MTQSNPKSTRDAAYNDFLDEHYATLDAARAALNSALDALDAARNAADDALDAE